jgi:hypothetical protein
VGRRQPSFDLLGGDGGMRRLVLALVGLVLVAGCTSDPGTPDPSPSPTPSSTAPVTAAPPPAAPAVDACYQLSYDEAVARSNTSSAVPCTQKHTSQTYAVGALDLVSGGHLLAVDSDAARAQVAQQCPRKLAAYVGLSPEQLRLSMLRAIWFTPSVEEGDAGASWFRCDLVAPEGDSELAALARSLKGTLKDPSAAATFTMCATAQPGSPGFTHVPCRADHTWKAISVVDLPAKKAYPGEKAVRSAGEDGTCADAARETASDALDYQWGYEWPTAEQWAAGQTYGRCWAPD